MVQSTHLRNFHLRSEGVGILIHQLLGGHWLRASPWGITSLALYPTPEQQPCGMPMPASESHWSTRKMPQECGLGTNVPSTPAQCFPRLQQKMRIPWWLSGKESAANAGDTSSIPGSGRSPGEENGYPFQYSCLENPMDRGYWWATVYEVAKESDTT